MGKKEKKKTKPKKIKIKNKNKKSPQNKLKKKKKANLPRVSCSFTLVRVHLCSPVVVSFVSFPSYGWAAVGIRDLLSLSLMKCAASVIPSQHGGCSYSEEISDFVFWN